VRYFTISPISQNSGSNVVVQWDITQTFYNTMVITSSIECGGRHLYLVSKLLIHNSSIVLQAINWNLSLYSFFEIHELKVIFFKDQECNNFYW